MFYRIKVNPKGIFISKIDVYQCLKKITEQAAHNENPLIKFFEAIN